jgi:hypothetical protein
MAVDGTRSAQIGSQREMTDRVMDTPSAHPGRRRERVDALLARVSRVEARREGRERYRNGRGVGALLVAVWASAVLSALLLDDVPGPGAYLLPAAGICTGLVCLAIPWERTSPGWLHLAVAVATAEVAAWVALAELSYGVYYVLLAAYAGYVSRRRAEVVGQAALIGVALLVPLTYGPRPGAVAGNALLFMSAVVVISAMAAWVRGQVTARQRLYRQFAVEALRLALRIRGDALPPQPPELLSERGSAMEDGSSEEAFELLATELESLAAPRATVNRLDRGLGVLRAAGIAAVIAVGFPLAAAGLASAGVTMPKVARAPFDALSIDLPNQGVATATDESGPARSVSDEGQSRVRPQSGPGRHASAAPPGRTGPPTDRDEPSARGVQAAPDGPAASVPAEGVSLGGVGVMVGGASTPEPAQGPPLPGDLDATPLSLLPGGAAGSVDPVSPDPTEGVGVGGLARAMDRAPPR